MKRASLLIDNLFEKLNIKKEDESFTDIFNGWFKIVGMDLALHSKIIEIEQETLIIGVSHPGWGQIIHLKQNDIFKKINSFYPGLGIKKIKTIQVNL